METKKKVLVVGSGSWGTALANVCADSGHSTVIWGRDAALLKDIQEKKENTKYLKKIILSKDLKTNPNLEEAILDCQYLICAIPTQQIRQVFEKWGGLLNGKVVINSSKGIEISTLQGVSEIFASFSPGVKYSVLSGPSFAEEVAKRLPAAVTVAAKDINLATEIQAMMSNSYFRIYTSQDVSGVELVGSLKNVIAIAAGIVNGLELGYNAQAAIINRGIAEMIRLGKHRGADALTFLGLAGMGDLILTCTGPLSRNRKLGFALGQGKSFDTAVKDLGGVAEGYYTAKSAILLSKKYGLHLPIAESIYRILYEEMSARQALTELMSRDLKTEWP